MLTIGISLFAISDYLMLFLLTFLFCLLKQHRTEFVGSLMLVIGGRTSGGEEQGKCVEVYDTESSDWYRINSFNRYRHTTVIIDSTMFVHGGFEPEFPNKPLDSMF
jgi:protein phosphatase